MTTGPRQSRLAVVVHLAALAGGFAFLLWCNRDQWFFGDEWDFLGHRGVLGAERSIWAPHTSHWSTLPILIYRALYARYGLRSYTPYVVVLLALHVVVAHLLWRLLRRVGVDLPVATALSVVFVLLGAGYENLLWAFQIGFIGSIAFGLGTLLLVDHEGGWGWRDVAGWVVSIGGLMFSGISVTMVTVAGLTVLMRRGARQAVLTVAVPGILYLVWFFLIGNENLGDDPRTVDDIFKYPEYVWTGLRSAMEQTVGFPGAGGLIVLGLAAFLLRRAGHASGPAAPAFACALGALMLFAVIAAGRAGLGVEQAGASRYTYIVMALALPGIGLALSELAGSSPGGPASATVGRRAVICLVLAMVSIHNVGVIRDEAKIQRRLERRLKARILAAAQLVTSPATILGGNPEPAYNPDIVIDDLRRMDREGKLPPPARITVDDRMTVATILQYATSPTALTSPNVPPLIDGVVGANDEHDGAGCIRLFPTAPVVELHLVGGNPMSVRVTTEVSADLFGYLRVFTPRVLTGYPHIDKIRARTPLYVNVTAAVDQVVLRVPASGTTEVCGVR